MSVIEVRNASKSYGHGTAATEVLHDVVLQVEAGEFVAITGPSGSGKSTLMNIVGLLDVPDDGTYTLDGTAIGSAKDKHLALLRLKHIGFVFQSFNLISSLSVRDNVELPMIYNKIGRKERHQRAKETLELMGIGDKIKARPNQLSGGQQQRVAIARALVNKPSLILADEPTGNLDTVSGQAIMAILKQLNSQGVTIVMITHDPNLAKESGRMVTIKDGQKIFDSKSSNTPITSATPQAFDSPIIDNNPVTAPQQVSNPNQKISDIMSQFRRPSIPSPTEQTPTRKSLPELVAEDMRALAERNKTLVNQQTTNAPQPNSQVPPVPTMAPAQTPSPMIQQTTQEPPAPVPRPVQSQQPEVITPTNPSNDSGGVSIEIHHDGESQ